MTLPLTPTLSPAGGEGEKQLKFWRARTGAT